MESLSKGGLILKIRVQTEDGKEQTIIASKFETVRGFKMILSQAFQLDHRCFQIVHEESSLE